MTTQIIRNTQGVITVGRFCVFGNSKKPLSLSPSCAWRTLTDKEAYLTASNGYSYYSFGVSLGFDFENFLPIREEQLDSIDRIMGMKTDFYIDDVSTGINTLTHIGSLDTFKYVPAYRTYIESTYVEGETKYDTYDRYYIYERTPVSELPQEVKTLVDSFDAAVGDGKVSDSIELTIESEILARSAFETGDDVALQTYWVNLRLYSSARIGEVAAIHTATDTCQLTDDTHTGLVTLSSRTDDSYAWTAENFPESAGVKFITGVGTFTSLETATGFITNS